MRGGGVIKSPYAFYSIIKKTRKQTWPQQLETTGQPESHIHRKKRKKEARKNAAKLHSEKTSIIGKKKKIVP